MSVFMRRKSLYVAFIRNTKKNCMFVVYKCYKVNDCAVLSETNMNIHTESDLLKRTQKVAS